MNTLVIDMGNTRMHFAFFLGLKLEYDWHLSSHESDVELVLNALVLAQTKTSFSVQKIMICSVVPSHEHVLNQVCQQLFSLQPVWVDSLGVNRLMPIHYDSIAALGSDRAVNAWAARACWGAPLIVVDAGTAITFDLVNGQGHYQAGPILAGVNLAFQSLRSAAQLKNIGFGLSRELTVNNTSEAMHAGCYWSAVEAISGIISRIKKVDGFAQATVIATGGSMLHLKDDIRLELHHEPLLTLEGLARLALKL
ncbi:MAG: type III pantothenate kinase [Mariprofundaceae bacterium]|nr:type III pantothenate kinase [Mariprofundaceae bacterium]